MNTTFRGDHWIMSPPAAPRPGLVTRLTDLIDRTQELRDELGQTSKSLMGEVTDRQQLGADVVSGFQRLSSQTDKALSVGDGLSKAVDALRKQVAALASQGDALDQRLKRLERRNVPAKKAAPPPRRSRSTAPPAVPSPPGKP